MPDRGDHRDEVLEFPFTNRSDAIYTKTSGLVDDDGRAGRRGSWLGGEDDDTSAWMRSTSPSGSEPTEPCQLVGRARVRRAPAEHGEEPARGEEGTDSGGVVSLVYAAAVLIGAIGVITGRNPCTVRCAC